MQLEKNKSRWLRRWWLETIGQTQQEHEKENTFNNNNKRDDNIQLSPTHFAEGGKIIKTHGENNNGRIVFSRSELPKRSLYISPKQQLSEALQGCRARVKAEMEELNCRKMEMSPPSPSRNNKRPSPSSTAEGGTELYADERPRKRIKRQTLFHPSSELPAPESSSPELKENVQKVLATAGVSPDSIIRLINNEEDRTEIIKQTGFSNNYIMKLQRKVLRSASGLQLRNPDVYQIGDAQVHVLFDSNNTALFIKKELCELLSMKGTTFSYWKKKSNVEELDTSQDFRLMDQCRSIFGGRSTYTLYAVDATLAILSRMESSRQRGIFRATALQQLLQIARSYVNGEEEEELTFHKPPTSMAVKAEKAASPACC